MPEDIVVRDWPFEAAHFHVGSLTRVNGSSIDRVERAWGSSMPQAKFLFLNDGTILKHDNSFPASELQLLAA
jgi:hypothetical protein